MGKEKKYNNIYDKLFRDCNTAGNIFKHNHSWSDYELNLIKEILIVYTILAKIILGT